MTRLLQVLVAAVLLWLVIRNVDSRALVDTFANFRFQSIIAAVVLFFLACGVAASKWRLLWRKATWWQMLNANFASQFYSLILPGQLAGEVVKTFRVGRRFSDTAGVAASVLVDRATGLVGVLLLACGGALLSDSTVARKAVTPLVIVTVALVCALYVITLPTVSGAAASIVGRIGTAYRWLSGVSRQAVSFLSAWASLVSQARTTVAAIALGIAYQAIVVCINFIIARDLGVEVSLADWCWIIGLVAIALLLPITIAGIGVREGAYVGLLGLLGVPIEKAIAVSIMIFAVSLFGAMAGAVVELVSLIRAGARSA